VGEEPADPRGGEWVAIDFETSNEQRDSACALGLAVVRDGEVTKTAAWLIRPPEMRFDWRCTRVHGIRARDVVDAPEFPDVWLEVSEYLGDGRLLAHNASFDIAVLRTMLAAYGLEAPELRYACTLAMSRRAWPDLPRHRLDTMCEHCGIELVHHDAASDARACAWLALRAAEQVGAPDVESAVRAMGIRTHRL
jgi:DNA polymerase III subunit epsilon